MLIKDNNTELYHSGIYLGKDYSDGIKHWKYIKKIRKNGKWVYIYDNTKLNTLKNNVQNSTANRDQHKAIIDDINYTKKNGYKNSTFSGPNDLGAEVYDFKKSGNNSKTVKYKTLDEGLNYHKKAYDDRQKELNNDIKEYNKYKNKLSVKLGMALTKTLNSLSSLRDKGKNNTLKILKRK